jgi:5-methylthioadenosine/S-adenosylhomocysteine deaminase
MDSNYPIPVDFLITHGTVLPMDAASSVIPDGAVAISGSRIAAVGGTAALESQFQPRQTLDAAGMLVMPGLINTHTHSGDALFRGLVEDLPLERWLEKLWVAEARFLNPETVGWGARLAYIEMVRSGITTALDMFWYPDTLVEAAREVGFRLATGVVYFDSSIADGIAPEDRSPRARQFLAQYAADELIIPCVQPHGVYTVSPRYLRQAGELAQEFGALFTTHASETETEVRNCQQAYGCTPIQHLDRLGALTPRTVLAHCVHLADGEADLLGQRGVSVAHCPVSNMKLASGIADVGQMLRAGVNVTLGTDGPVSGNDLNLWTTMRTAAILHKTVNKDPYLMPTRQVVSMVTRQAARALGIGERAGSLEAGKLADVILLKTGQAHTTPAFDPYALLVYSLGREDVDTVLINGRLVMRHRELLTIDENEVLQTVSRLGAEIGEFMASQS